MATQKAYRKGTGTEVQPGEMITNFRGERRKFEKVTRDGGEGYSAKVQTEGDFAKYAQVYVDIEVR